MSGLAIVLAATFGVQASATAAPAGAVCSGLLPPAVAQERSRRVRSDDLVRLRDLGSLSVSPDGGKIAFELRRADPVSNSYCSGVFIMDLNRRSIVRVDLGDQARTDRFSNFGLIGFPGGAWADNTPRWSPDGQWVAYLKRVDGVDQLWRGRIDGARVEPLVATSVDILDFRWTAESAGLNFTSRPKLDAFRKALDGEAERGFLYNDRFAPGVSKTPMPRDVPIETRHLDIASGRILTLDDKAGASLSPDAPTAVPAGAPWSRSPTGSLAWFHGAPGSDAGLHVASEKRTVRCEDRVCRDGIVDLWWGDDHTVQFLRREGWARNRTVLYAWNVERRSLEKLFSTGYRLDNCQPAVNQVVCLHEEAAKPAHVVSISKAGGAIRVMFDPNPEFRNIALQPARRLYWKNNRGLEAYGDLILPSGRTSGHKHPLIVVGYNNVRQFHRGGSGDEYPIQLFAASGFAVLSYARPNWIGPSSSDEGGDPLKANLRDWADRRSVHSSLDAALDAAIATGVVDPKRVGITGLSDAAMTAQWALINSDRFAAASISSLISRTGFLAIGGPARATLFRKSGLVSLPIPESLAFWRQASIAENPEAVKAPLLVQVADDELLSGLDSYEALRELRRPVELYVFPGEHHVKWKPAHREAVYRRNVQWFDFWLNNRQHGDPLDPQQYDRWEALRRSNP